MSLSWSYSESTNTTCFSSPSSPSSVFHFSPYLQLMHLFRGLLLFFKDTHQGHSCLSHHQSPPSTLRLPSTSLLSPSSSFLPSFAFYFCSDNEMLAVIFVIRIPSFVKYTTQNIQMQNSPGLSTSPLSILSWCLQSSFHLPPHGGGGGGVG